MFWTPFESQMWNLFESQVSRGQRKFRGKRKLRKRVERKRVEKEGRQKEDRETEREQGREKEEIQREEKKREKEEKESREERQGEEKEKEEQREIAERVKKVQRLENRYTGNKWLNIRLLFLKLFIKIAHTALSFNLLL